MPITITVPEITVHNQSVSQDRAQAMISSAIARAVFYAPCLAAAKVDPAKAAAAKSIIIDAILRWADRGSGAVVTETAGIFGRTVAPTSSTLFYPSEITDLRAMCEQSTGGVPLANMPESGSGYPDAADRPYGRRPGS